MEGINLVNDVVNKKTRSFSNSSNYGSIISIKSVSNTNFNSNSNGELETMDFDNNESINDIFYKLKLYGLNDKDINRVINGEISLEKLMEEIYSDTNTTRKEEIMKNSYLKSFGLEFNSMEELIEGINDIDNELNLLMQQKNNINNYELDATIKIINRLQMGENLENILNTEYVAWEYIDDQGNKCYRYDNPYVEGNYNNIQYKALSYQDVYGESDILKKLKSVLTEQEINPFFGDNYKVYRWIGTNEQLEFLDSISVSYSDNLENREKNIKELDEKIKELQEKKSNYQYIENYVNDEVNYYINNVDKYLSLDDFGSNSSFDVSNLDVIDKVSSWHKDTVSVNGDYTAAGSYYVDNKEDLVSFISCILNDKAGIKDGLLKIDGVDVRLSSNDIMLEHYVKWESLITDSERDVFNYLYNTEGVEEAYKYLEDIGGELDNRWLANKTKEDQEYASLNPFLSSIASIVVTPLEGMNAACSSIYSLLNNKDIMKSDVYSAGNVWRGQVGQDILENYGEGWAFAYNTGMSMADTGTLIALSAATGGTATPALSASLMGARSYVSTLNDALDRGMSDGSAVLLAGTSALVESAMESYSVGHLLNLENALGSKATKIVNKVANSIPDPKLASIATKTAYIGAGALSQGLCEGEEEFATEILNFVADEIISGDLGNHTLAINNYENLGYSEEEARRLANKDFLDQAKMAFLGGMVSGICFGGFNGVKSTHYTSKQIANGMLSDFNGTEAQKFGTIISINNMLGGDLRSWIPNENSTSKIYGDLLKACDKANLSIESEEITKTIKVLDSMKDYYKRARDELDVRIEDTFDTYRTHGIVHILDVFTQSINTYGVFKDVGAKNISLDAILLSAVMHDTGMSGGKQLKLSTKDGNLVIDVLDEVQKSGKNIRESHSYNSADILLQEAEKLHNIGYSYETIAEAALLAFAHSKSNSGLQELDNEAGWSFAIQALQEGIGEKFNLIEVLNDAGIIKGESSLSLEVKVKSPNLYLMDGNNFQTYKDEKENTKYAVSSEEGGTKTGKIKLFEFSDDWLQRLSYEALSVRIGDALTNNDNAGTNQYGGVIKILDDYSKQMSISDLANEFNFKEESFMRSLFDMKNGLEEAAGKEAARVKYQVQTKDGRFKDYKVAQHFVLGEANQSYSIDKVGNDAVVTVTVKDTNKLPLCTIFAIHERLGELKTKGSSIFTSGESKLKLVIELDSFADASVIDLYNQYAIEAEKVSNGVELDIKFK